MKKTILFILLICLTGAVPLTGQSLLKKAAGAMKDELFGTKKVNTTEPEPACARPDAEQIVGLGGNLNLGYTETNISVISDGSILLEDRMTGNNFIVKDGKTTGPIKGDDPRLAPFKNIGDIKTNEGDPWVLKYKEIISKAGEKYLITFAGKTYGPYSLINDFAVSMSKNNFAAMVTENVISTEADGKRMEKEIENAKTDQEKMELAMQYSQQVAQKMMEGGGPEALTPKLISSLPDTYYDMIKEAGATINGTAKYDDIILISYDKVFDLKGNQVMTLKPEHAGSKDLLINSANTKYAVNKYRTLIFSDGTSITDLLNARQIKVDGKTYIAYMYYSPKNNAIMQCKIPW